MRRTLGFSANIIYAGDFNLNGSSESTYQTMIASGVGQAIDPLNPAGNWTASSSFANLLTESATALDYRDDFQFVTAPMTSGSGGLQLVPGSCTVFGNNGSMALGGSVGQTGNTALGDLPNKSAVLSALTTATDHLPVVADYSFTVPSPVPEPGTLATLAVGAICCLALRSWRHRRSVASLFGFRSKTRST